MTTALKLKKGDTVQMLTGKDRGKQGRILDARPRDGKVIVENLNLMTKHQKPRPIRDSSRMGGSQIAPGGRVELAAARGRARGCLRGKATAPNPRRGRAGV